MPFTFGQSGPPAAAGKLGYDAADDTSGRRKAIVSNLKSEDKELTPAKRKKLLALARDLPRNFSIAAWAIRKHLDYVASFTFKSSTGDEAVDKRVEELLTWYGRRHNCDAAKRHPLRRQVRIAEARRTLDGDVFPLKLADGHLQWIEGDRIRNPIGGNLPAGVERAKLVHGVLTGAAGDARAFCVNRRNGHGGYIFERMVSAARMIQHGYFDRFDQVRGISPVVSALNPLRDAYERFDYALARSKVGQMFALALFRDSGDEPGDTAEDADGKPTVDFGKGPVLLDLNQDDKAEFLTDKTPSSEFGEFTAAIIAATLKALDIPYSFYDESFSVYSGSRQALLQYEQSAAAKRADNQDLLDELTAWRLSLFIRDGFLELPGRMTLADLSWEWIPTGLPWIDPLKEVNADVKAVDARLTSRTRVCRRRGVNWETIADELDREEKRLGITPDTSA